MDLKSLIFSFLGLMIVICGILAFVLRWFLFSSTESSVRRLDDEIDRKREQQIELSRKLKQVDEELEQKRAEARELATRMHNEAEQGSKAKKEEMIQNARKESEEILEKAKESTKKLRAQLEKEMDIRAVGFGMDILNKILSQKSRGAFDQVLLEEFVENLKLTDTAHIGPEVSTVEMITVNPASDTIKNQIAAILTGKLGRNIQINASTDAEIGGGVILKFGSLALDGSIKNLIRETGLSMQTHLEAQKV